MRFFGIAGLRIAAHAVTQAAKFSIERENMATNSNLTHEVKTYHGFLALMKWGTIASIAVAAFVILMIA